MNNMYIYFIKNANKLAYLISIQQSQDKMSLFIIGSVSRVTSSIIHHIAKTNQYSSVRVADLLPEYHYHHRYYRLQRELEQQNAKLNLSLTRLQNINDILSGSKYDDVLYVTHDYYQSVTSKTKLMELTAQAFKHRKYLYFATPVEYDHFAYANPELTYQEAEDKVFKINPNSTFIRSDVQDQTQTLAGLRSNTNPAFKPKLVRTSEFAKTVCETMAAKVQGKRILVRGTQNLDAKNYNHLVEESEYKHSRQNLSQLIAKYSGISFSGYNGQTRTPKIQKVEKVQKTQKSEKSSSH